MSQTNYEEIWEALYRHMCQALGSAVVSCGRRHVIPPELGPEAQPACFVLQGPHKVTIQRPVQKVTLRGFLVLYVYAPPDDSTIGSETQLAATQMNSLFAAVDVALQPDDIRHQWFTLGGLVHRCQIEGDAHVEFDALGAQAFAALPITMLVP